MKELYLAGGPYYGLQEVFSKVKGVARVRAGFANCSREAPSKEDIYSGKAEGRECIQIIYNPKKIDIVSLLSLFFTIINPYTDGIQGKAVGPSTGAGFITPAMRIPCRSATTSSSCRTGALPAP